MRLQTGAFLPVLALALATHATTPAVIAIVVGGFGSLLAGELARALTARRLGVAYLHVHINLIGGLSHFRLTDNTSRRRALAIVTGPITWLALGGLVWVARSAAAPAPGTAAAQVYRELLLVTLGWGVVNLVPVSPFDGGRLLHCALGRARSQRNRITAWISVAVALVMAALFAAHYQLVLAAVFVLLAILNSVAAAANLSPANVANIACGLQPAREATSRTTTTVRPGHDVSTKVFVRLLATPTLEPRLVAEAQELCRTDPAVEPAVRALGQAMTQNDPAAERELWELYEQQPTDVWVRSSVLAWRAYRHDWHGVLEMVPVLRHTNKIAMNYTVAVAYTFGAYVDGARIGETAISHGYRNAQFAYNVACCQARAGHTDVAFSSLQRSVAFGWNNWQHLDADRDFDALRAMPDYRGWRASYPTEPAGVVPSNAPSRSQTQ